VPSLRYRTGIVKNSYTGTTLNAAQSKEVDVAMLPAVLAKNASARGSQVNTQCDTTLKPIIPSMREAMLNQQHAAVFEQQRARLAEFEQRINCQRATITALQFVILSSPICWQSWPRKIFKKTKRRAKPVLLSQLLAIYGQEAEPVRAASSGQASSTW
jgi:hypothetical protein